MIDIRNKRNYSIISNYTEFISFSPVSLRTPPGGLAGSVPPAMAWISRQEWSFQMDAEEEQCMGLRILICVRDQEIAKLYKRRKVNL